MTYIEAVILAVGGQDTYKRIVTTEPAILEMEIRAVHVSEIYLRSRIGTPGDPDVFDEWSDWKPSNDAIICSLDGWEVRE